MTHATINWISESVLRASTHRPFRVNETALVGPQKLLGEVIRIHGDEVVIQVYEDTTGLRPGDPVSGTGTELSVQLGPGLLGNIFDGLLRPLANQGVHVKPGAGGQQSGKTYPFKPSVRVGTRLTSGNVFGTVHRPDALAQHCLVPPDCQGEVVEISPAGEYTEDQPICKLRRSTGETCVIAMAHYWPVRQPRPIAEHLPTEGPLFTGQRILDSIFPLACGGRAAMPGGFGTGKTCLLYTSDAADEFCHV